MQLRFMQLSEIHSHLQTQGTRPIWVGPFRHPLPKLSGPGGNARAFFWFRISPVGIERKKPTGATSIPLLGALAGTRSSAG